MKISVLSAGVHSEHDVAHVQQWVGEIATVSGLDADRCEALYGEVSRISDGLLAQGGGEIEVLVDDGPTHDFILCAGDKVVRIAGQVGEPASVEMSTPRTAEHAGVPWRVVRRATAGVSGRMRPDAASRFSVTPPRDVATELRSKLSSVVVDDGGDRLTLLEVVTALRSKEEQLRKLTRAVEQSPSMIMITDTSGCIEYVNPKFSEITGFSPEDIIGKTPNILKSGEMSPDFYGQMWQTILAGNEWRGEILNRKMNGDLYWELASISPIRDEFGVVTHFIAIKEDITDRKRVEQQLVDAREAAMKASEAKSEFLANMSHEIRTPLNAIVGMADLLWETPLAPDQREYVRIFRRAGSTLLNLINDILDLSKVESGHLALESVDFDLRSLMEKTVEVLALPAHEKDVELVCYVRPEVPTALSGDPTRLRQVVTNLVGNAIKFTEHGEVVVEVGLDHSVGSGSLDGHRKLLFTVRDTGIGIPREKLEAIFDRFAQAGPDTTRRHGGTGLGLTISKQLVEMMGGSIWVDSEVGYGSTFHFTADFGLRQEPPRLLPVDQYDLRELKVLVVDDNSTNRFILREMLATCGARVSTASGGRLALLELRRAREQADPYRLVLLDCRMPDMDGFELARRIREEQCDRETTLVMLTSDRLNDDRALTQEMGISHCLAKPIKRSELIDGIAAALGTPASTAPVPAEAVEPILEDSRPLRVLLVEDSEDSRLLIQSYLKKTPYLLDFAENGEQGVDLFRAGRYDVVLMDAQMPVMDGTAATRTIRAWEAELGLKATPIIALTAFAQREDAQRSLEAGCDAHLAKPVKKSKLLDTIVEITGGAAQSAIDECEVIEADGRILVRADSDIKDLIPRYLENRRKEVALLKKILEDGNFEEIKNIGHTLKGTGGGYGFRVISEIGRTLEKAAAGRDEEEIRLGIERLEDYLSRVEVVAA